MKFHNNHTYASKFALLSTDEMRMPIMKWRSSVPIMQQFRELAILNTYAYAFLILNAKHVAVWTKAKRDG